jgi:hypothetical protein
MENRKFIKMSDLVGDDITINTVRKFVYKKWDNDNKKMLMSDNWQQGFQKVYPVDTDKGTLDMTSTKIGEMLESVSKDGESSIIGRTFNIKSNGKTGIDIRYYINPARLDTSGDGYKKASETITNIRAKLSANDDDQFEPISLDEIPF